MDLVFPFVRAVELALAKLGPPRIDRLALYRAEVKAAAADGSTVDLQPEDPRLSPMQQVPVRVGLPGAVAVVQPGSVVLVGWERGDDARPFAVPAWESGASVTKLVLHASVIYLGGEGGAEALVRKSDFDGHTHAAGGLAAPNGPVTGATAGATPSTGTSIVRGK